MSAVPASAPTPLAGSLFVVAAPSGAGKTSLVRALLRVRPTIELSISTTTRAARAGELEGRDYFFVTPAEFERQQADGQFLEWAEVHGNRYGTSRPWILSRMAAGADILLEIDCQGAAQVGQLYPDAVTVFIAPPSVQALRERLVSRGQDPVDVIDRRVAAASAELKQAGRFQYVIINQDFEVASQQLLAVVDAAGLRCEKQRSRHPVLFSQLGA